VLIAASTNQEARVQAAERSRPIYNSS
jgi:hypothetical protein